MIQGLLIELVLKRIFKKFNLDKIKKYVEEDNELDIHISQLQKTVNKQGKYIEEIEKDVATLKKNSHPPQEYICCKKCGCKIAKTKAI